MADFIAYNGAGQTVTTSPATNTSAYSVKPDAYYDKMLLKMLRQMEFKFAKYADEKSLPKNFGDTINWRRFNKLSVTKNPLVEGVTPEGQTVSGSQVSATIAQYGNVMYFTDVIDLMQLDKVRQEYTVELGYQAKETLDEIVRDVIVAEGSVYFAGAKASIAAIESGVPADVIPQIDDFRKITLGMRKGFIGGNRKANGKYVALVSPDVMAKLFDDQRTKDYMNYGQTNGMFSDGMVVDMFGIRFEEVLNAPIVGNVHDSVVIGENAYGITKLEGAGLKVITKGLGSAGVADPLDQRQSIGWKITGFGAKVIDPSAIVNYWSKPGDLAYAEGSVSETALGTATFTVALNTESTNTATLLAGDNAITLPKTIYTYGQAAAFLGYDVAELFATATAHATAITSTTALSADVTVYLYQA